MNATREVEKVNKRRRQHTHTKRETHTQTDTHTLSLSLSLSCVQTKRFSCLVQSEELSELVGVAGLYDCVDAAGGHTHYYCGLDARD